MKHITKYFALAGALMLFSSSMIFWIHCLKVKSYLQQLKISEI